MIVTVGFEEVQEFSMTLEQPILVTGASGAVGWHLCRFLNAQGKTVVGTFRESVPSLEGVSFRQLRLEDPESVEALFAPQSYQAVIHCAALSHPDTCEQHPQQAQTVNVLGTRRLMEGLGDQGRFVYLSTDLVFDGAKGNYVEDDSTNPVNEYARGKRRAEEYVLSRSNSMVLRLSKVFGWGSPFHDCFLDWVRSRFEKQQQVPLFHDQYRSFVYIGMVVRALECLIAAHPHHNLYHLGGSQRLSRLDLGELFAQTFGFDRSLISPVSVESVGGQAARGKDCSLDSSRLTEELGFQNRSVSEELQRMKEERY